MKNNIAVIGKYNDETIIIDEMFDNNLFNYYHFETIEDYNKVKSLHIDVIILLANELETEKAIEEVIYLKETYSKELIVILKNKDIVSKLLSENITNYICYPIIDTELIIMVNRIIKVKENMEMINQFINNNNYLISVTDSEEKYLYVNKSFCVETGYSKNELIGKTPKLLESGEHSFMFYDNLIETLEVGMIWKGLFHNKRKNNTLYFQDTSIYPVIINDRNKYYISISRNITKEKIILDERKREIEIASKIQLKLLSDDFHDENISIKAKYYPYSDVSGDLYKWHKISKDKYVVLLADVVGHGVGSALITTVIVGIFKSQLEKENGEKNILKEINNGLISVFQGNELLSNYYCTAVYLIIDIKEKTIEYFNCGHPQIYLIDNNDVNSLISSNLPIGLFDNVEFKSKIINYTKDSEILLYTDGIIEIPIEYAKMVNVLESELMNYKNNKNTDKKLLCHIENEILEHYFNKINDDITLISIKLL